MELELGGVAQVVTGHRQDGGVGDELARGDRPRDERAGAPGLDAEEVVGAVGGALDIGAEFLGDAVHMGSRHQVVDDHVAVFTEGLGDLRGMGGGG
jgi:hypothetical protein